MRLLAKAYHDAYYSKGISLLRQTFSLQNAGDEWVKWLLFNLRRGSAHLSRTGRTWVEPEHILDILFDLWVSSSTKRLMWFPPFWVGRLETSPNRQQKFPHFCQLFPLDFYNAWDSWCTLSNSIYKTPKWVSLYHLETCHIKSVPEIYYQVGNISKHLSEPLILSLNSQGGGSAMWQPHLRHFSTPKNLVAWFFLHYWASWRP
jgi:hypothetical protein